MRHYTLMRSLLRWTLRVFVPRKFENAIPAFRHALNEEFKRPLRPSDGEDLLWFFRQRREATRQPAFVPDARYLEAMPFEYVFQITSSPCSRHTFSRTVNRGALNCFAAAVRAARACRCRVLDGCRCQ